MIFKLLDCLFIISRVPYIKPVACKFIDIYFFSPLPEIEQQIRQIKPFSKRDIRNDRWLEDVNSCADIVSIRRFFYIVRKPVVCITMNYTRSEERRVGKEC